MAKKNEIESITIDVIKKLTSESIEKDSKGGVLACLDWTKTEDGYEILDINTNIDHGMLELKQFYFDKFVGILKDKKIEHLLVLRNINHMPLPSDVWINKLKDFLSTENIEYSEYIVDSYPSPIPEFDVPENVYILRLSYDPLSKFDYHAAQHEIFIDFLEKNNFNYSKEYTNKNYLMIDKYKGDLKVDRLMFICEVNKCELMSDIFKKTDWKV